MKQPKRLLLALLAAVGSLCANAYDFKVDGIYYTITSSTTVAVTSARSASPYNDASTHQGVVTIPSSVSYGGESYSVTAIGKCAFAGSKSLTSVDISASVTEIGERAFENCTGLTSVMIPVSVTAIGEMAFASCSALNSVVIPNSVTTTGKFVFYCCSGLTSAIIGGSLTTIEEGMFAGCWSLTSVVIPNSVTKIGFGAFMSDSRLTSVVIPASVTTIESRAFDGCSGLTEITSVNPTPPTVAGAAFYNVSTSTCLLKVPSESVKVYKEAYGWQDFKNIMPLDEQETKTCALPTIELVDGQLLVSSATEGAKCYTTVTSDDFKNYDGTEPINLCGIYIITSYAHAEGFQNSETVTATLAWVQPTEDEDALLRMETTKALLIKLEGGRIVVCGTERGEQIQLYSVGGSQLCSTTAADGQTILPYTVEKGTIVLVRYGEKSIKIAF